MRALKAAIKFRVHQLWFAGRDLLQPPTIMLSRVGIKPGDRVVDYGCGAGSYSLPAALLAGPAGHVFAVDVNPYAIRRVQRAARDQGVTNVTVVESDRPLPIASQTVDVVLLYDVVHDVRDRQGVLEELHRVLKADGILSVRDHHLPAKALLALMGERNLFGVVSHSRGLYRFAPQPGGSAAGDGVAEEASGL